MTLTACSAPRAVLPEVVHVLDDHDHSRGEEEEGRGGQDLDGGPPERHGGDGEGDEEENHSVSSPARGGLPSPLERVRCLPPLDLCMDSGSGARHGRWPNIGRAFCVCSSLVGSERLLIRCVLPSVLCEASRLAGGSARL